MKLEPDLIREILLWCEKFTPDEHRSYSTDEIEIKGFTPFQRVFHFKLLIEYGYIDAIDASAGNRMEFIINNLTLYGYEYLELIKNDTVWNKYKQAAKEIGITVIKEAIPILIKIVGQTYLP